MMNKSRTTFKRKHVNAAIYIVSIILAILSLLPFWIMLVNATRSTYQIQQHAISLFPSEFLAKNFSAGSSLDRSAGVQFSAD